MFTGMLNSPWLKAGLILCYCMVVMVICRYAKKLSYYDMDIIFYTACAIEQPGDTPARLHERTYSIARRDMSAQVFRRSTDSSSYFRHSVYRSPDNFYSQLPFYRIKPLYVGVLAAAWQAGYSPIVFSTWLNLICYCSIALLLLLFLIRKAGFYTGWFVSLCVILMPLLLDTARSNTPDLPAALLLFLSVLLLLSNTSRLRYWAIPLFCLLIFTRPENILLVAAFCLIGYFYRRPAFPVKFLTILFAASFASYLVVALAFRAYPWALLYRHSFIGYIPDLQHASQTLSLKEYLSGLRMLPNSVFYSDFFVMIFLLVFPLFYTGNKKSNAALLSYSLLLCLLGRLFIFPDFTARFYTGYFVVSAVLFVSTLITAKREAAEHLLVDKHERLGKIGP